MTKTMLVDVGREETFITITNETSHGTAIKTERVNNNSATSFFNLARRVYDSFFANGVDKLIVDKNGLGNGLIDQLILRFEDNGFSYNCKNGTVQPVANHNLNKKMKVFRLSDGELELERTKMKTVLYASISSGVVVGLPDEQLRGVGATTMLIEYANNNKDVVILVGNKDSLKVLEYYGYNEGKHQSERFLENKKYLVDDGVSGAVVKSLTEKGLLLGGFYRIL